MMASRINVTLHRTSTYGDKDNWSLGVMNLTREEAETLSRAITNNAIPAIEGARRILPTQAEAEEQRKRMEWLQLTATDPDMVERVKELLAEDASKAMMAQSPARRVPETEYAMFKKQATEKPGNRFSGLDLDDVTEAEQVSKSEA